MIMADDGVRLCALCRKRPTERKMSINDGPTKQNNCQTRNQIERGLMIKEAIPKEISKLSIKRLNSVASAMKTKIRGAAKIEYHPTRYNVAT